MAYLTSSGTNQSTHGGPWNAGIDHAANPRLYAWAFARVKEIRGWSDVELARALACDVTKLRHVGSFNVPQRGAVPVANPFGGTPWAVDGEELRRHAGLFGVDSRRLWAILAQVPLGEDA